MKSLVVGPVNIVAELVQHSVHDLFQGKELPLVGRVAKTQAYFLAFVPVETEEVLLWRPEFGQNTDSPASLAHDGLYEGGDFSESLESFCLAGAEFLVLIFRDDEVGFGHSDRLYS